MFIGQGAMMCMVTIDYYISHTERIKKPKIDDRMSVPFKREYDEKQKVTRIYNPLSDRMVNIGGAAGKRALQMESRKMHTIDIDNGGGGGAYKGGRSMRSDDKPKVLVEIDEDSMVVSTSLPDDFETAAWGKKQHTPIASSFHPMDSPSSASTRSMSRQTSCSSVKSDDSTGLGAGIKKMGL